MSTSTLLPTPVALTCRVTELLKLGEEKLGYLKIVTPRFASDAVERTDRGGRYVVAKSGDVVDSTSVEATSSGRAVHKYVRAWRLCVINMRASVVCVCAYAWLRAWCSLWDAWCSRLCPDGVVQGVQRSPHLSLNDVIVA